MGDILEEIVAFKRKEVEKFKKELLLQVSLPSSSASHHQKDGLPAMPLRKGLPIAIRQMVQQH